MPQSSSNGHSYDADWRRFTFTVSLVSGGRRTALRGVRIRFARRTLVTRTRGRATMAMVPCSRMCIRKENWHKL